MHYVFGSSNHLQWKTIRHNLFLGFKNYNFWVKLLFLSALFGYLGFNLLKAIKEIPDPLITYLTLQGVAILLPSAALIFLLWFILGDLLIKEKNSRRLEFQLANGISPLELWGGLVIGGTILISTLLFWVLFILIIWIYYFDLNSYLNFNFVILWFLILPMLTLALNALFCLIGFLIKRTDIMQNIIWIGAFFLTFGGSYLLNNFSSSSVTDLSLINFKINLYFFCCSGAVFLLCLSIINKINKETIILNVPD